MADYFTQFSTSIAVHNKKEHDWWDKLLTVNPEEFDRAPQWVKDILHKIANESGNDPGDLDFQFELSDTGLWFYAETFGSPFNVGLAMQAYLKQFKSGETFSFTWAATCSKMRVDEFGGGYVVVTQDEVIMEGTTRLANIAIAEVHKKKDLGQL